MNNAFVPSAWDFSRCTYRIQYGDTVTGLAALYGVTRQAIVDVNSDVNRQLVNSALYGFFAYDEPLSTNAVLVLQMPSAACVRASNMAGDSVCGPGKILFRRPPNKSVCVPAQCEYVRDPVSGKCYPPPPAPPPSGPGTPGYQNPEVTCPPGSVPVNGTCVRTGQVNQPGAPGVVCPGKTRYDAATGTCVPIYSAGGLGVAEVEIGNGATVATVLRHFGVSGIDALRQLAEANPEKVTETDGVAGFSTEINVKKGDVLRVPEAWTVGVGAYSPYLPTQKPKSPIKEPPSGLPQGYGSDQIGPCPVPPVGTVYRTTLQVATIFGTIPYYLWTYADGPFGPFGHVYYAARTDSAPEKKVFSGKTYRRYPGGFAAAIVNGELRNIDSAYSGAGSSTVLGKVLSQSAPIPDSLGVASYGAVAPEGYGVIEPQVTGDGVSFCFYEMQEGDTVDNLVSGYGYVTSRNDILLLNRAFVTTSDYGALWNDDPRPGLVIRVPWVMCQVALAHGAAGGGASTNVTTDTGIVCPAGEVFDPASQRCVSRGPVYQNEIGSYEGFDFSCPKGFMPFVNRQNRKGCVPVSCPYGRNPLSGTCFPAPPPSGPGTPGYQNPQITCPPGSVPVGGKCVAVPNVSAGAPAGIACPPKTVYNPVTGECMPLSVGVRGATMETKSYEVEVGEGADLASVAKAFGVAGADVGMAVQILAELNVDRLTLIREVGVGAWEAKVEKGTAVRIPADWPDLPEIGVAAGFKPTVGVDGPVPRMPTPYCGEGHWRSVVIQTVLGNVEYILYYDTDDDVLMRLAAGGDWHSISIVTQAPSAWKIYSDDGEMTYGIVLSWGACYQGAPPAGCPAGQHLVNGKCVPISRQQGQVFERGPIFTSKPPGVGAMMAPTSARGFTSSSFGGVTRLDRLPFTTLPMWGATWQWDPSANFLQCYDVWNGSGWERHCAVAGSNGVPVYLAPSGLAESVPLSQRFVVAPQAVAARVGVLGVGLIAGPAVVSLDRMPFEWNALPWFREQYAADGSMEWHCYDVWTGSSWERRCSVFRGGRPVFRVPLDYMNRVVFANPRGFPNVRRFLVAPAAIRARIGVLGVGAYSPYLPSQKPKSPIKEPPSGLPPGYGSDQIGSDQIGPCPVPPVDTVYRTTLQVATIFGTIPYYLWTYPGSIDAVNYAARTDSAPEKEVFSGKTYRQYPGGFDAAIVNGELRSLQSSTVLGKVLSQSACVTDPEPPPPTGHSNTVPLGVGTVWQPDQMGSVVQQWLAYAQSAGIALPGAPSWLPATPGFDWAKAMASAAASWISGTNPGASLPGVTNPGTLPDPAALTATILPWVNAAGTWIAAVGPGGDVHPPPGAESLLTLIPNFQNLVSYFKNLLASPPPGVPALPAPPTGQDMTSYANALAAMAASWWGLVAPTLASVAKSGGVPSDPKAAWQWILQAADFARHYVPGAPDVTHILPPLNGTAPTGADCGTAAHWDPSQGKCVANPGQPPNPNPGPPATCPDGSKPDTTKPAGQQCRANTKPAGGGAAPSSNTGLVVAGVLGLLAVVAIAAAA
jgi:hypothetical protein